MLQQFSDIDQGSPRTTGLHAPPPIGAAAFSIHVAARDLDVPLVYVAASPRRAAAILQVLQALDPERTVALYPAWDALPHEMTPPSPLAMGRRMSVLRWLTDPVHRPRIVLTTADAIIRRVPPRAIWNKAHIELRVGDRVEQAELERQLRRIGYRFEGRVDEHGEAAIRDRVIDLFPAAAAFPCRVELKDGQVSEIRSYDPQTQRSLQGTQHLIVDPASEIIADRDDEVLADGFSQDWETRLAEAYEALDTLVDYAPDMRLILEEGVEEIARDFHMTIEQAYPTDTKGRSLFLDRQEWRSWIDANLSADMLLQQKAAQLGAVPRPVEERAPWKALAALIGDRIAAGYRIVLTAPDEDRLDEYLAKAGRASKRKIARAPWAKVFDRSAAEIAGAVLPLDEGFEAVAEKLVVLPLRDVIGHPGGTAPAATGQHPALSNHEYRIGDAVVHIDHGVGLLEGIETVETDGMARDTVRLRYADERALLVPSAEIGAIWRYGGDPEAVTLDRLGTDGWLKRRNTVMLAVRQTAEAMVEMAREREARKCPRINVPMRQYERFCARFPFELTADQAAAIDGILRQIAGGRPMDRLICGDVGFGKTEVALRAAAAVALAGRQVVVIAPTTVLAQQHFRQFQRRFAGFDVEVALLMGDLGESERTGIRDGIAQGRTRIVIGTHALAAEDIVFADLALVVVDEEQRFGMRQKAAFEGLGKQAHLLTMTATPIPRTLQGALVGLRDIALIATAPVSRHAVATSVHEFSRNIVHDALMREKRRGGQSFLVCPRIEDIEPMREQLAGIVPDLEIVTAHGRLSAERLDSVILGFAEGHGDVLLATGIIESGLDVPRANTMIVCGPDRFGLSQLHQLRGRVGRGSRRAFFLLLPETLDALTGEARRRFEILQEMSQLGAGFEISMRDLDLRGAGDLVGEDQAGHLNMIGLGLYRHFLARALLIAKGESVEDRARPEIQIGEGGSFPADYVADENTRINLYARVDAATDRRALRALDAELHDRFGTPPENVQTLLALADLRATAASCGIRRLEAGPQAIALTPFAGPAKCLAALKKAFGDSAYESSGRIVVKKTGDDASIKDAKKALAALSGKPAQNRKRKASGS